MLLVRVGGETPASDAQMNRPLGRAGDAHLFLWLRNRRGQAAGNATECCADAGRKALHRKDRAQSDQSSNERILNQVLTRFVTKQVLQGLNIFHWLTSTKKHRGGSLSLGLPPSIP